MSVARVAAGQEAIEVAQRLAAAFAPGAGQRDRQRQVPAHELEAVRISGLLAVTIPVELGGAGISTTDLVEVIRVLAIADASIAQVLQNHFVFVRWFLDHGTLEQRRRFSRIVVGGARLGNALSERSGSRTGEIATRLSTTADDAVLALSGRKYYSTGALTAQWIPVRTLGVDGGDAVAYVPRDAHGLTVLDDWRSLGQRGTHSGTVILDDVRVPVDDIVAPGTPRPTTAGAFGQIIHVAIDVGLAQGALAAAVDFVRTRSRAYVDSAAARASEDPHVLAETARLEIQARSAAALLREAATRIDVAGDMPTEAQAAEASVAVAAAKVIAAEAAVTVANELFALAGTSATDEQHGLDRWWRDARVHTLHDPNRYKLHHIGNYVLNGVLPSGPLI